MNIRLFFFIITLVTLFSQCKSKEETTLVPENPSTTNAGMTVPDSIAALQKPAASVETSPSCYSANSSKIEIISNNDITQGTFSYSKNGKKIIDGKILGTTVNDTIKAIVLSSVNGVSKPQDVWLVKSDEALILLEGELVKDEKNAYRYANPKALKPSTTFQKGKCN